MKLFKGMLCVVVGVIVLAGVTLAAGAMGWSKTAGEALRFVSASAEPREFFAADGIEVGVPVKSGEGKYEIPISLETAIIHSGQKVYSVNAVVEGQSIRMTAKYALVGKDTYPGYVEISGINPGEYELEYLDPDGTLHPVEEIQLP